MDQSERDEKIYIMREKGASYPAIAKTFNISTERVRQIYFRIKDRKENFDSWPPLKQLLSYRVQNALTNYFKNQNILESPQKIAALGRDDVRRIKNIGKKSIRELAFALHTLGLIRQDDKWFEP